MSVRLYWARNDGMSGHVFLGPLEMRLLGQEMLVQGMTAGFALEELDPDARIGAAEIEAALANASPKPLSFEDEKLWRDWLAFLEGAVENGGVVARR